MTPFSSTERKGTYNCGQNRLTQIPVPDIPHIAHDLITQPLAFIHAEFESLPDWIYSVEVGLRESLVDQRRSG